jgi:hypothetical protein
MTIAGQTFAVSQGGAASCSYSIRPGSVIISASAATYTVQVTATAGCAWTATSNSPFLGIVSGASGTGNGTVTWSATADTGGTRIGSLKIAGITFTVTQL